MFALKKKKYKEPNQHDSQMSASAEEKIAGKIQLRRRLMTRQLLKIVILKLKFFI